MSKFEGSAPPGAGPGDRSSQGGRDVLTLFPYQARLVSRILRHTHHALAEQPMGSGKTVVVKALIALGLGVHFSHVLIAAPQEQIESSFTSGSPRWIEWPKGLAAQPRLEITPGLIEAARNGGSGSRRHIRRYLRLRSPGFAIACTHSALTVLEPGDLLANLQGHVLVVDEGHHGAAPELGRLIETWIERGGRVILCTATPYRADSVPVLLPGMVHHRRSISEHMAEGYAPTKLESEIIAVGRADDHVTGAQFHGEEPPPGSYRAELVSAIVKKWLQDGRPKTIVRVPPARGGSASLTAELIRAFDAVKARVLDATGVHASDKKRFIQALESERSKTYETSEYDVVVGIQRVHEASDWRHCAVGYCVGVPASLTTSVQFIGRTLRLKPASYPEPYRDLAKITFFVPSAGGSSLDLLSLSHSRHALLLATFMADHATGHEWIVTRAVRQGIESGLGKLGVSVAAEAADEEAVSPIDPQVRAEVELALASARDALMTSKEAEPTVEAIFELAVAERPDLPGEAFERVGVEILAAQRGAEGHTVQRRIARLVARKLRIDPQIRKAFREAFAIVLEEFRKSTLKTSPVLDEVGRQIHSLTGRSSMHFARRLRDSIPRPLTVAKILEWADAHFEECGEWPVATSGAVIGAPDEKWESIDSALRSGFRGLPAGGSLARLLATHRNVPNPLDRPRLDVPTILDRADEWKKETGRWPTRDAGEVPGTDYTWNSVDQALQDGGRGLEVSGTSLARLLEAKRGKRNIRTLPPLSVETVLEWTDAYFEEHGEWPTRKSGQITGAASGETWARIAAAIENGYRALPKHTSFSAFLRAERGAESNHRLRNRLTDDRILALLRDYNARNPGEWPVETTKDPVLRKRHGLTWRMIDRALREGTRGQKGGSSIVKFLAEKLGVRNRTRPGPITEDQLWRWIVQHRKRTGKWPSRNSGAVSGQPHETWANLHACLRTGGRGLHGGETLRQFIERRSRRRRAS